MAARLDTTGAGEGSVTELLSGVEFKNGLHCKKNGYTKPYKNGYVKVSDKGKRACKIVLNCL